MLQAQKVTKIFQGPEPLEILSGIDLQVEKGESVALVGASGEGKSTLLHILGTLEPPTSGKIIIDGQEASEKNASELRCFKIGFVFQSFHLLDEYSVLENIQMPARIARRKPDTERARFLLKMVGLEPRANFSAKQLSGGEKQRAAIARALFNDPPLVLADEPTGNLDHKTAGAIHDLLLSLSQAFGKTLVVVTHNLNFAKNCSKQFRLSTGQLKIDN